MDSDIHNHYHNNNINSNNNNQQQQQQQQNMNSGLTRYRSAPSAYFSNLINSGVYKDEDLDPFFNARVSSPETERILSRFISGDGDNNRNLDEFQQQQMVYQNQAQSQEVVRNNNNNNTAVVVDRLPMDTSTNLVRQSSSPAGFLEHINTDNGYPMMRSVHQFQYGKGPMTRNNGGYWDDSSSMLNDKFLEDFGESDQINSSKNQEKMNDEGRIRSVHAPTGLTHQLSLPTSSTELSVKERLMQFQDNVPLRSRAKRGCATHPRSIAERVRRTRISERMRKLQDLVPNMDKQTSTADMLDLAVDYIKELQNQVETLSDRRTKCTCPNKMKL